MPNEPPVFAKQMNRWCIAMTHSRRRRDAKRARKGVLRQMKRLLRTIGEHARRHRRHLAADYARTRFSERQATRPHHCAHRRHARATAGRDQTGPRTHHRRAISAQRREDPLRLRTRRADRGPGQGVWRSRVWQHFHDQCERDGVDHRLAVVSGNDSGRMASVRPEPRAPESVRPEHPDQSGEHRPRLLDQTAVRTLGRSRHL
ncbi:MAG: hypothetical protein J6386_04445 [Candidatus Synoicihabitans palmerolidicus]|nr:hypothetical protein [Candidatus Synoicihabitans palmerolidicus]